MTAKERNEHLINKWSFMLEPLDKKKSSKIRYAKLFENTALYSNTSLIKLALPLLQRIIYTVPTIKISTSSKIIYMLGEFDRNSVLDGLTIMPDGTSVFIDKMAKTFMEKYETEFEKLNHIMLRSDAEKIKVYLFY